MFTFLYGLRFRLFLLLGLVLLPLLGLTLRTASAQRELAAAQAKAEALRMTRLVVSNQNALTASVHHLLTALAQLSEIRSDDPAECSALLAEPLKQYPGYTNLNVAAQDGGRSVIVGFQPDTQQERSRRGLLVGGLVHGLISFYISSIANGCFRKCFRKGGRSLQFCEGENITMIPLLEAGRGI